MSGQPSKPPESRSDLFGLRSFDWVQGYIWTDNLPHFQPAEFYEAMTSQNITDPPIDNPMAYIDTDDPGQIAAFKAVNDAAYAMYQVILGQCVRSAERTLAVRKLQEARMWANAAIAFDGRTYKT